MEKVVDGVGTGEADAVLYVALAVESETGGEVIVEEETQKISDGIGDRLVQKRKQQKVKDVLGRAGYDTDKGKAHRLAH